MFLKANLFFSIFHKYAPSMSIFKIVHSPTLRFSTSHLKSTDSSDKNFSAGEIPIFEVVPGKPPKPPEIVDWLPFQWKRRPKENFFAESGDYIKHLEYDPTWPKPDFELSEELKTASDDIKYKFSLATASKAQIKEAVTRRILEKIQRHPNDFDSLEVKIALKTIQIRALFEHSKQYPKEIRGSKRGLEMIIKQRFHLLKLLKKSDEERFDWVCKELKLHYSFPKLGGKKEFYCKKWDLRRLTKEYCKEQIEDKKKAYHEELKSQQEDFLKEKAEILAWIEKEENELANLTIK